MLFSETQPAEPRLSFDEFVERNLAKLELNLCDFLNPILDVVNRLHVQGLFHGGIHPGALQFKPAGELDGEFFHAQKRAAGSRHDPRVPHSFLAPETLDGSGEDLRTDCYALGALIYYIVTGSPPAPASRRGKQNFQLKPTDYPRWKPAVLNAANGCLPLAKDSRIKNAQELWNVLTRDVHESNTSASETAVEAPAEKSAPTGFQPLQTPLDQAISPAPTAFPVKLQIRDRLPNASVAKPYRQNLRELFGERIDRVAAIAIALPENSGLNFDETESILHGTPTTAGEVKLVLSYRLTDSPPERPTLTHTVALTVNPEPSSLWKNIPSDATGAFAKSDFDKASLVTPHLTTLAASLRGRSHAHEGKYRDDDFALRFIEATGWHIFIAADGAGSAKFSRRGSQLACKTALTELERDLCTTNALDEALEKLGTDASDGELEKLRRVSANLLMPAAYKAFTVIYQQAKESQATLRDFATTFITVIGRQIQNHWFFASFAVGDGGAGAMLDKEKVQLLTQPDSGDFAGQTMFLTMQQVFSNSESLLARTQAAFCADFKFLAVMTDGITDPIFQSDANFASASAWEAWRQQLTQVVNLDAPTSGMEDALLDYLNFPSPGNHDDRTLIIAVPKPA